MPYCFHCHYYSDRKRRIQKHIETQHLAKSQAAGKHQCCLCNLYSTSNRKEVLSHYVDVHDVRIQSISVHRFDNFEGFLSWKGKVEAKDGSSYIITRRRKERNVENITYACHRDGYFKSKGKGKRSMKLKGSNKINGYCPSSITAKVFADGKITAKFLPTHVGHTNEIGRLELSKETKDITALKITQKNDLIKRHIESTKLSTPSIKDQIIVKEITNNGQQGSCDDLRKKVVVLSNDVLSLCQSQEDYEVVIKQLLTAAHIIKSQRAVSASDLVEEAKINTKQKISPQKRFVSVKRKSSDISKKTGLHARDQQRDIRAKLLLEGGNVH